MKSDRFRRSGLLVGAALLVCAFATAGLVVVGCGSSPSESASTEQRVWHLRKAQGEMW